ncbi:SDR family oxidoreductase [Aeromicrobium sp. P5_D10]
MTIAVTAATGQLGSLVIDSLLKRTPASDVVAVVRDAAKAQPLADKGVTVRVADYDDRAALDQALSGVDRVLLISGNEMGKRFQQHKNVIDAAVAQNVSRIVYTSAPFADTSSLPVAPEHLLTEQYLATVDVEKSLLRNGWYNENYLGALDSAAGTGSVLTSAGAGQVASAARADYAEAASVVLTSDSVEPVYELSGDTAWTQAELAKTVGDVIGKPVESAQVSPEQQAEILAGAGLDPALIGFLVETDASISKGELGHTNGVLSQLIGRPTTPLVESLRAAR